MVRIIAVMSLLLMSSAAYAASFSSIQFGGSAYQANYTSSIYDWDTLSSSDIPHNVRIAAFGINATTFYGEEFGILASTNLQFSPLVAISNGGYIDANDFDLRITESAIFGIGYRFTLDWGDIVTGGGPHFSTIMLNAKWKPYDGSARPETINTGYNAGVGALGLLRVHVIANVYFVTTYSLGFDFVPILNFDRIRNTTVVETSLSSGIGVSY